MDLSSENLTSSEVLKFLKAKHNLTYYSGWGFMYDLEETDYYEHFEVAYHSDIPFEYTRHDVYFVIEHVPTTTYYKKRGSFESYSSTVEFNDEWEVCEKLVKEVEVYE